MGKIAPEERKKFLLLLLLIVVAIGVFGYRLCSGSMTDRTLETAALRFLEAGDAGDFDLCRQLTGLDGQRFAVFRANRSSLGALKSRTLVSRSPLRFNQRTGWLFFFDGNFENGVVREEIAVLTEPGKEPDVYSVRYEYARLPRPVSRSHYSGSGSAAIRAQVERCAEAYDRREWKYFEAIARRETGNERRGAGQGLEKFRKRFGDPVARSLMQETRYQETLPGCLHLGILRVTNRTSYKVKNVTWVAEEFVWLVLNRMDDQPRWEVYAFEPGKPQRLTPPPPKKKKRPAEKNT